MSLQNLNKMCCFVLKFLLAKMFKWKTYFELQIVMQRRIYRCFLVCIYVVAKTEESYHKMRKIKHLRLFTQSKQGWYYVERKNCFDEKNENKMWIDVQQLSHQVTNFNWQTAVKTTKCTKIGTHTHTHTHTISLSLSLSLRTPYLPVIWFKLLWETPVSRSLLSLSLPPSLSPPPKKRHTHSLTLTQQTSPRAACSIVMFPNIFEFGEHLLL